MYNLGTILLLANGALTVLFTSVAYTTCIMHHRNKDIFLFLLLSKICVFFLFSKGSLMKRAIEQKYATFVVVYEILCSLYLHHIGSLGSDETAVIMLMNGLYLLSILLGIYNTHRHVPYTTYRRLLSGEMDILYYNVTLSAEILVFISQFSCALYLISDNSLISKGIIIAFLILSIWGSGRYLVCSAASVVLWAFKDVLLLQSVSGITLFVSSAVTLGVLLADNYLSWSIRNPFPKRIPLE